jgi:hypothetical protein
VQSGAATCAHRREAEEERREELGQKNRAREEGERRVEHGDGGDLDAESLANL